MAEVEAPLKSFALSVADPISLKESNSLPCKNFKELYADCELNTSFSKEKLDAKIKSDLALLEMELFSTIQKSHEYLQQLQNRCWLGQHFRTQSCIQRHLWQFVFYRKLADGCRAGL